MNELNSFGDNIFLIEGNVKDRLCIKAIQISDMNDYCPSAIKNQSIVFLLPKQQIFDPPTEQVYKYSINNQPSMQKESQVRHNHLHDLFQKLNLIANQINLSKDLLLGFILRDVGLVTPDLVNDLNSVVELLIDIRDCQVITKNSFLQFIVVFSHVCHSLHKHKIKNLMQFYQQTIDQVTNDSDYLRNRYFIQERKAGKIANNSDIKSQILVSKLKIEERINEIEAMKSKMQEKKPGSKISQIRMEQLKRNKSQLAECPVCMVEINYENISILSCGHIYHQQCFEQCMKESILNKRFPLKCPVEQCTKHIQTDDVEEYLSKDLLEKYYEFTLHNFVDKNSTNMTWCPTPGCTNAFEFDQGITELNCPKCSKSYCLKCKTDSHPDRTCEQNMEMMNMSQEDKQFLNYVKGAKYKQCPKCKFWVSKNKGCCHMTCRCSYEFCYVCGSKYGDCNCQEDYDNYYGSPDNSVDSGVNDEEEDQDFQLGGIFD